MTASGSHRRYAQLFNSFCGSRHKCEHTNCIALICLCFLCPYSPLRRGCRIASAHLYARARTSCAHSARDRGCSVHPVSPAPSDSFRGAKLSQTPGAPRRGNAKACLPVIPAQRLCRCRWRCERKRASKDESATAGPSPFEARKSAHLRMTEDQWNHARGNPEPIP